MKKPRTVLECVGTLEKGPNRIYLKTYRRCVGRRQTRGDAGEEIGLSAAQTQQPVPSRHSEHLVPGPPRKCFIFRFISIFISGSVRCLQTTRTKGFRLSLSLSLSLSILMMCRPNAIAVLETGGIEGGAKSRPVPPIFSHFETLHRWTFLQHHAERRGAGRGRCRAAAERDSTRLLHPNRRVCDVPFRSRLSSYLGLEFPVSDSDDRSVSWKSSDRTFELSIVQKKKTKTSLHPLSKFKSECQIDAKVGLGETPPSPASDETASRVAFCTFFHTQRLESV